MPVSLFRAFLGILAISQIVNGRKIYSCDACVPLEILQEPAYGIGLAMEYLTLAVKHPNGTITQVGSWNASKSYATLMARYLAFAGTRKKRIGEMISTGRHFPDDHGVFEHRPDDIEVLVDGIDQLLRSSSLSAPIKHLGVAIAPMLLELVEEPLREALLQMNLLLPGYFPLGSSFMPNYYAVVSAYVSGMCRYGHIADSSICRGEGIDESYLIVEYENSTFSVSYVRVFLSQFLMWDDEFVDAGLGGHALIGLDATETEAYWEKLADQVALFITTQETARKQGPFPGLPPLGQFIVIGAIGQDADLHRALKVAFQKSLTPNLVAKLLDSFKDDWSPMFLPAIGVATLEKDYMDAPKPLGCSESLKCDAVREKVRLELMKMDTLSHLSFGINITYT